MAFPKGTTAALGLLLEFNTVFISLYLKDLKVKFTTKKDKLICANPEENWVKKAVQYLKRKAKRRTNLTEVTTAKEE
uniref:Chemokine interleukin-8-like domain-containing protein n=1 Tax=Xenopus tropicalis TaxID=8364 RepID=A0A803JX38_XENTR